MRTAIDSLIVLMLLAILAGVIFQDRLDPREDLALADVRLDVQYFQQEIQVRTVLESPGAASVPPTEIKAGWFAKKLPRNTLLRPEAPWLEIADPDEAGLDHPRDPIAITGGSAQFWYNPGRGVVRARVPSHLSGPTALKWYNHVNDCRLTSLLGVTRP